MFTALIIPFKEIDDFIYLWQYDAIYYSIKSVEQQYFRQSELQNKSQDEIVFVLNTQKDVDRFDTYSISYKGVLLYYG